MAASGGAVNHFHDLTELAASFSEALGAAMTKRDQMQTMVRDEWGGYDVPAWALHEREVMLAAVNSERKARGFTPVMMMQIVRVEGQAVGHSDYQRKFAFYCAELVIGEGE